jgi:hypothetical protein
MALTNAQKQARWRERNVIALTAPAQEIAEKLLAMDRDRLVTILDCINAFMKEPLPFPNTPRTKAAAERALQSDRSYAVQIVGFDGTRLGNGVRVGSMEQAQLYASTVPNQIEQTSYAATEVVEYNEPPLNSIYVDRYRRPQITFAHDTCGSLTWRPLSPPNSPPVEPAPPATDASALAATARQAKQIREQTKADRAGKRFSRGPR